MSNLTTRKIVLGLLMVLVLAFSVQGIADALTFGTSRTGDLQTVLANDDFSITFRPDLVGPVDVNDSDPSIARHRRASTTDIEYAAGTRDRPAAPDPITRNFTVTVDVYSSDDTHYYTVTTTSIVRNTADTADVTRTLHTRNWTTEADAYHYNAEQVTISVSGGTATLKKVGRYDAPSNGILMETGKDGSKLLDSSMTLTFTAAAAAELTITISDSTSLREDYPTGVTPADLLTFTVYVVGPLNIAAGTTAVATGTDGVERVSDQQDTRINGHFTFSSANEPVYYSVEGSGRLYVSPISDRSRRTSSTNNLYTSSSAPVHLDTSGGSSKVTAYIAGSSETAIVLYLFSGGTLSTLPRIEVQSGSPQTGAPSGRLDDYFEVKVTDGRRRPVSGVPVTFRTSPAGAMFIPVPRTKIYAAAPTSASIDAVEPDITIAEATSAFPPASNSVQTDRNGVAKIYYQLSDTPGAHTVTATAYGIGIDATLTATASTSSRARIANLEIVSGNNQRADKGQDLTDDLVVIVRSLAGHRVQDVIIQFRTTTGTLVPSETTDQRDPVLGQNLGTYLNPRSGQQIYVETGPNGEAGVTYNVGQLSKRGMSSQRSGKKHKRRLSTISRLTGWCSMSMVVVAQVNRVNRHSPQRRRGRSRLCRRVLMASRVRR